jgi:hypothetical protein
MNLLKPSLAGAALLALCGVVNAQENTEPLRVSFSDASRPGVLHVGIIAGSIIVKAGDSKDVLVKASGRNENPGYAPSNGSLRRLTQQPALNIEEQNNRMVIGSPNSSRPMDLEIQVPVRTSLELSTVNSGDITVDGVEGELEISNVNGSIALTGVKGSVVAHTVNGKVAATLKGVTPQKPMAFSTLNGNVDVSFPASLKANLRLRTDNGEVFTDFDLQVRTEPNAPVVEDTRRSDGRYRVKVNKVIYGAVNGGGPEIEVRTFNGNLYVRKGG